jgi:hypothetical protein
MPTHQVRDHERHLRIVTTKKYRADLFSVEEIVCNLFCFLALFIVLNVISHLLPVRRLPARANLPDFKHNILRPNAGRTFSLIYRKTYGILKKCRKIGLRPGQGTTQAAFGLQMDLKVQLLNASLNCTPVRLFCKRYQRTEAIPRCCSPLSKDTG